MSANLDNKQIFDLITQKYQPSANEKANRANNPSVQGVPALAPDAMAQHAG